MHGMHKMGFGHAVLSQAEALGLSDEQMGKIARIELRNQKKHHEVMERMHQGMRAIHDGLMDPSTDTASLRRLAQEHARVHQDMVEDKIKARDEVLAVLNTEQRGKLGSLLKRPGPGAPHWRHPPPSTKP
jgi:Spy/CpxP family protein refolding chaperone